MTAVYAIAIHNVTDPAQLRQYREGARPTLAAAEVLAVDESATTLEGRPRSRVVILKFPDEETARRWYESADYQSVLPLRLGATSDGWAGLVSGVRDV